MKNGRTYEEALKAYNEDCEAIAEQCEAEGYPANGSNYELRCAQLEQDYPELFGEGDEEEEDDEPTAREILIADGNTAAEAGRRLEDGTYTIYRAEDLTTPGEGELEEIAGCMRAGNFDEDEIAEHCAEIARCARGEELPPVDWSACTCKGRRYLIGYTN